MEENNVDGKEISKNKRKKLDNKINFVSKGEQEPLVDFYNNKIKKIHIIVSAISMVIFAIMFFVSLKTPEKYVDGVATGLVEQIKSVGLLTFLMVFTGTIPYFFLGFLGELQVFYLIEDFGIRMALGNSLGITAFLGGLINIIGLTLSMAVGLYGCYLTTKKRKYYNASQFSMTDIKMNFYRLSKKDEKVEEYEKKKEEKLKKAESDNVKMPYFNLILLGIVAFIIQIIGLLISKI